MYKRLFVLQKGEHMKKSWFMVLGFLIVLAGAVGLLRSGKFPVGIVQRGNADTDAVGQRGKLIVGTDATYPPMESVDANGAVIGFDADIIAEVAKEIGVPLELKNVEWDDLFATLKRGDIDMAISSITITPERSKEMSFSNPYMNAGLTAVFRKADTGIETVSDLKGKFIGVQIDTISQGEALKVTDDAKVKRYKDYDPAVADLKAGRIEAIFIDFPPGAYIVQKDPSLTMFPEPFTSEFYGIAVAKGKEGLLVPINKVIASMKQSGQYDAIKKKWLTR